MSGTVRWVTSGTSSTTFDNDARYMVEIHDDAELETSPAKKKKKEVDIEPDRYFKLLKGKLRKTHYEKLQKRLDVIGAQIIKAKEVGQTAFLEQLAFTYDVLVKEQILHTKGYKKYVYKKDVKEFIDKVKPKNSIRIIELGRFPRAIPDDVLQKIAEVKADNIFDEYLVVFTDLTGKKGSDYQSQEEKAFVKRNRDPIVFGYFRHLKTGMNHDRLYFIADWQDKYCDLTFDSMISRMANEGIKEAEHETGMNHEYLQELAKSVMDDLNKEKKSWDDIPDIPDIDNQEKLPWWKKLFKAA